MHTILLVLFATGAYPLGLGWRAARGTSLFPAVHWALAAWFSWCVAHVLEGAEPGGLAAWGSRYFALCLTGCAGVAVLGARRPGVSAWNFVLGGLLAVLLLPLVENLVGLGRPLDWLRLVFLGGTLATILLNYGRTCWTLSAILLTLGCGWEASVLNHEPAGARATLVLAPLAGILIALVPWIALAEWRLRRPGTTAFDRMWLHFRDRYGGFWAERVRDQFNRAATNAGWPIQLTWRGLHPATPEAAPATVTDTLRALLRRFEREPQER